MKQRPSYVLAGRGRRLVPVASLIALALLAAPAPPPATATIPTATPRYALTFLGGLGGNPPDSGAVGINDRGWAVGDATLPGGTTEHAALWRNGVITDLGTLGGENSAIGAVATPSDTGLIAGWAQTSTLDPLGEAWGSNFACTPAGGTCEGWQDQTLGFVWKQGRIVALPTLGGNNAYAFGGVNDHGQVVGVAETATVDATCVSPQVLDWEAVVWGPRAGEIRELPPYPGDPVGLAAAINDEGQVVGTSGSCTTPLGAGSNFRHALLWRDGLPIDLGNLGGGAEQRRRGNQQPGSGSRVLRSARRQYRPCLHLATRRDVRPRHPARGCVQQRVGHQRSGSGGRTIVRRERQLSGGSLAARRDARSQRDHGPEHPERLVRSALGPRHQLLD
jgi:probable HAF family extracellular repeat protein